MACETTPPFNKLPPKGRALTMGTVCQTEGAVPAVSCLGCQHHGHEGHSPLGGATHMLQ